MRLLAAALSALLVHHAYPSDGAPGRPGPAAGETLRVLFVGNSLTEANDLPAMVRAIGLLPGRRKLLAQALTAGGASLEDHWNAGRFQQVLTRERFDFVVLQQGPSSLPESRANLRTWSDRIARLCRQRGARVAFYMVWPEERRLRYMPQVAESYRLAARDVGGVLLPVGEAWMAAWRLDRDVPLYGPDRFHPSEVGSLLAALVIYRGLTGDLRATLPESITIAGPPVRELRIAPSMARLVNRAADSVTVRAPSVPSHP